MPRFATPQPRVAAGPLQTAAQIADTRTHEGGAGFTYTPETELFLSSVSDLFQDTFYEKLDDRVERRAALITKVSPEFLGGMVLWLRSTANLRTVPMTLAVEAAINHVPGARAMVAGALQRADEPSEAAAYWMARTGASTLKRAPKALLRGIADAVQRLYNERSLIKYDTGRLTPTFGQILDVTHAKAKSDWQGDLFRYAAMYRRFDDVEVPESLSTLRANKALRTMNPLERATVSAEDLRAAGFTHEQASGWDQAGGTREQWERMIDAGMGYMAVLKNLSNFEKAGISRAHIDKINALLADPAKVATSKQFPYRFLSAYLANRSLTFASALEQALDLSVSNIPEFGGRSLVLVDTSGSMQNPVSQKRSNKGDVVGESMIQRVQIGALLGSALAGRGEAVDLVGYASSYGPIPISRSVLRTVEDINKMIGRWDHGTETWAAVRGAYNGHDRVFIFTDEQAFPDHGGHSRGLYGYGGTRGAETRGGVPANVPIYTWNLGGYKAGHLPTTSKNFVFGGFTDALFSLIPMLEAGYSQSWPWEK